MSTCESNTYTTVKTRSQRQTKKKSGVEIYPFNSNPMKPLGRKRKTIKKVKNSPNTLIALGNKEKKPMIKVEYMNSTVLEDVTQLKVFYTQQMINELLDDDYWWEDDVMNTFLCILSRIFHEKYSDSIIHPQVVVNYFYDLGKKFILI